MKEESVDETNLYYWLLIADESMTKQICTITQEYKLWDICFYLCVLLKIKHEYILLLLMWNLYDKGSDYKQVYNPGRGES